MDDKLANIAQMLEKKFDRLSKSYDPQSGTVTFKFEVSIVEIGRTKDSTFSTGRPYITVRNKDGLSIESRSYSAESQEADVIERVRERGRRAALRVDETIDGIAEHLRKL